VFARAERTSHIRQPVYNILIGAVEPNRRSEQLMAATITVGLLMNLD
jgi:hypothetical protein